MVYTMGQAAMMTQVLGAISSTVGSFYSAQSQKSALNAQADLADINSRVAELSAQSQLDQGNQQVAQASLAAGQLKSRQRTSLAANGVDLGQGSAAEIQASTDVMKDTDINTIKANAVRNAWGTRTQSVNYQNQANIARTNASSLSPASSAFSSLMTSAGSVASSWYMMDKIGAFTPDDIAKANKTDDPIGTLSALRGWNY